MLLGTANTHLYKLDFFQNAVLKVSTALFFLRFLCHQAAAIGLICKFLDGENHGNLYNFHLHLASYTTSLSSCLSLLGNEAEDCCLVIQQTC